MSFLSLQQLRSLFDSLTTQYETLSDNRTKLEADCNKLREYIDAQVQQIQTLNADFEKLRQDFAARRGELGGRSMSLDPDLTQPPHQPSQPPQQPPQADENIDQDWEVSVIVPSETIEHPIIVSLLAEIVDVSVICSTAFSPDGTCLAIGSDKTLRIYNIDKDDFLFQYNLEEGDEQATNHIRSIAWTSDSKTVVCGGEDGKVRVFSLPDQQLTNTIEAGDGEVFQVCISNNNEFFAAVSGDGLLSLFKMSDFSLICELKRESDTTIVATSVAISADDKVIAVGYSDCNVTLWDVESRERLVTTLCHDNGVYAVKFVPKKSGDDRQRFVTASLDNSVKIWDIRWEENKPVLDLWKTLDGHSSFVLSLAVDPTGEWLLSGSKDLTARLSSVTTGTMVYSIKAHSNSVITVSFNPTGSMFCTGSGDQSVKIWSVTPEDTEDRQ